MSDASALQKRTRRVQLRCAVCNAMPQQAQQARWSMHLRSRFHLRKEQAAARRMPPAPTPLR